MYLYVHIMVELNNISWTRDNDDKPLQYKPVYKNTFV